MPGYERFGYDDLSLVGAPPAPGIGIAPIGGADTGPFNTGEFNQFGPAWVYFPTTFWEGLRRFIKEGAGIAALSEVYLRRTGMKPAYPFLVISPVQGQTRLSTSANYRVAYDVDFTVLSYDDVEAVTLGEALYKYLAPYSEDDTGAVSRRPRIAADDAVETAAVPGPQHLIEQEAKGPGNRNVWGSYFQYTFFLGRSMI